MNGERLTEFKQKQQKKQIIWYSIREDRRIRIGFDKENLNVFVNGKQPEVNSIFTDSGTEMVFSLTNENNQECSIKVSTIENLYLR